MAPLAEHAHIAPDGFLECLHIHGHALGNLRVRIPIIDTEAREHPRQKCATALRHDGIRGAFGVNNAVEGRAQSVVDPYLFLDISSCLRVLHTVS